MRSRIRLALLLVIISSGAFLCVACGGAASNQPRSAEQKVDEQEKDLRERLTKLEGENKQLTTENTNLKEQLAGIKTDRGLTNDEREARIKKDRKELDERMSKFEQERNELIANASLAKKLTADLELERKDKETRIAAAETARNEANAGFQNRMDWVIYPGLVTLVLLAILGAVLLYLSKKHSDSLRAADQQAQREADERIRRFEGMNERVKQGIDAFKSLTPEQAAALPPLVGHYLKRLENPESAPGA